MAEVTFAGLLSAATGEAPPVQPQQAQLPQAQLPQAQLPQAQLPQAAAIWPAAPAVAEIAAVGEPTASPRPEPAASSLPDPAANGAGPHGHAGPPGAARLRGPLLEV